MPPDALAGRIVRALPGAWRAPLISLALAWIGLIVTFRRDWQDMAAQWWDISTYNHILLVPAVVAWLVALRRRELARLVPSAWWPGLTVVAGGAMLWVLGDFAGLSLARQLAAVVMLQGAVAACLGPRLIAGLAFPLAYMLFLVPAGEELVPMLQLATARMTMTLLGLSGIPATLDGVFITTSDGYFKVAEACSGIKFLIAMAAFATLAANLCFKGWAKRAAFVALALTLAVLANGVRAWGTIVIAHWRGVEFASGFDHIFYGWIFFATVLAIVLATGWRWFDRAPDDPPIDAAQIAASPLLDGLARRVTTQQPVLGAIAALTIGALAWTFAASHLAAPLAARIDLPVVAGWHRVALDRGAAWEPRHAGADHRLLGRYADGEGGAVDVSFAVYASQTEGREAGGFGQGATPAGGAWSWAAPAASVGGGSGARIEAAGAPVRVAVTWYRSGTVTTGSNLRLKLANVADRLLLRANATSVLIVSAADRPGHPGEAAIGRFLAATGAPGAWMDRVASRG